MGTDFNDGVHYLYRGFGLLKNKRLWHLIVIPLIINILLFSGLFALGLHWMNVFTAWLNTHLPSWLVWLDWLIWLLFLFAGIIVLVYTFTLLANIIGAPFYGLLAEKVEKLETGQDIPGLGGIRGFLKLIPYVLRQQWRLFCYFAPRAIVCIVLFFIPIVQLAAPFIWFILNAWMMNIQYMTYPMENHQLSFAVMKSQFSAHRSLSLGFGSIITLGMMVPVVNLFVMPAAAAGATLLWIEKYKT